MIYRKLSIAMMMALGAQAANASGFALIEQSGSAQGTSYAGMAANVEDASIMWFNPAGLSELEKDELVFAGHIVAPHAPFNNDGSYVNGIGPIYGEEDNGANLALVPNLYWKTKWQDYDIGLGINVPFGSSVEYDQDWVGRYHAVYTSTKTVNINPNISRKVNDNLSVGFGLNAQYIDVNLTQKIDFTFGNQGLGSSEPTDGYADLKASGIGFGYNLGALYRFDNNAMLGFSYRSKIAHHAEGQAKFDVPDSQAGNPDYATQDIEASVDLPATASLSLLYPYNNKINLLADVSWTGWSSFKELRIEFEDRDDSVQPEDWNDIMRYSVGMTYQYSPKLILRTGVAFDETPIPSKELRTPRIPDSDRTWLSLGAGYQYSDNLRLDVAYSHVWGGNTDIVAADAETGLFNLVGDFDTSIDIFSAQLVWNY